MAGLMPRRTHHPPAREGWRRLLPGNIRARVVLVALAPLVPVLLLLLGSALSRLLTMDNAAVRENQQAARAVATAFTAYVQDLRRQEVIIGTAIATRGQPNWGWTNRLLTTSVSQHPALRNMSWLSPQGSVLASSVPSAIGTDVRRAAPIGQLLAGQTWIVSPVLPGPISRTESVEMAYAVRTSTGQLLGMLSAEVNPDK